MHAPFLHLGVALFIGAFAIAGAVIGLIIGLTQSAGSRSWLRALEAGLLALIGGLLARTFIYILLAALPQSPGTGLLIGWAFFLWPGVVDTFAAMAGEQVLTTPNRLLWIATGVGCLAGMMDGIWRIHRWKGLGVLTFGLDLTWGLAGTTNGCLIHLVNFAWAKHQPETRCGTHRYRSGFRFKGGFAFTQGAVMSNNAQGPGTPLYAHERVHVWQNRTFGPLFTLTYLGWMVLLFIPGIIGGAAKGTGVGTGIERLCYFNNPWEAWAYRVGHNHGAHPRSAWGDLIWSDGVVLVASIIYIAGIGGVAVLLIAI
jgi:hypothetical protein